jgi:hypothetical protein
MFSRFGVKKDRLQNREEPSFNKIPKATSSLPTVMLLLAQPLTIDSQLLFKTLCSRYKKSDGTEPLVSVANAMVSFAGIIIAIPTLPQALPDGWRELASPGRTPHWPTALEACAPHRAHMVLSIMGEQPNMLQATRVLTAVAGAIAALYPDQVLAGLWGAKTLNSREVWEKLSVLSFVPYPKLPNSLWVSQHPFKDEKTGGPGVLTLGLDRFVGRELELVGQGSDLKSLLDRAFGLTAYLIQNGAVLKDGSTFGISENERIAVTLKDSDRFSGLPVIAASLM